MPLRTAASSRARARRAAFAAVEAQQAGELVGEIEQLAIAVVHSPPRMIRLASASFPCASAYSAAARLRHSARFVRLRFQLPPDRWHSCAARISSWSKGTCGHLIRHEPRQAHNRPPADRLHRQSLIARMVANVERHANRLGRLRLREFKARPRHADQPRIPLARVHAGHDPLAQHAGRDQVPVVVLVESDAVPARDAQRQVAASRVEQLLLGAAHRLAAAFLPIRPLDHFSPPE